MQTATRLRPQPDARTARASRVEQRARRRHATRRAVWRGVIIGLWFVAALLLIAILAWLPQSNPVAVEGARLAAESATVTPNDRNAAHVGASTDGGASAASAFEPAHSASHAATAPTVVDSTAASASVEAVAPADARVGEWRTAAPVLLTAAAAEIPPFPADRSSEAAQLEAASTDDTDEAQVTDSRMGRDRSSGLVSANVTVRDPGMAATASDAAAGATRSGTAGRSTPGRSAAGSSGFVTVDVTVSEAVGVGDPTAILAALEPFDYRDHGDGTIAIDPDWVARNIVTEQVPLLGTVRCNEVMIAPLRGALQQVVDEGLADAIDAGDYGGCWAPRRIDRDPTKPLSMHAWGLAVDFNVATNALGAPPTLDPRVVAIFRQHGFHWGGDWSRPDGMHFELLGPR